MNIKRNPEKESMPRHDVIIAALERDGDILGSLDDLEYDTLCSGSVVNVDDDVGQILIDRRWCVCGTAVVDVAVDQNKEDE